jgi:hypothetical protein
LSKTGKAKRKPTVLFILAVEGQNQEKMYFERIKILINSIPNRKNNIDFRFVEPFGGDPKCVVERVLATSIGKTNKIAVFDHDGKTNKFEEAIDLGYQNNIHIGYTNYWLIWHKKDFNTIVADHHAYIEDLKLAFNLNNSLDIKNKSTVHLINSTIGLKEIKKAINRAEFVCRENKNTNIAITTPNKNNYYSNPDTSIHLVIKKIFNAVGL